MTNMVELQGGPYDGERLQVDDLLGRLEFEEKRETPLDVKGALLGGERVKVQDWENPDLIIHTYSRVEPAKVRGGARVYEYVKDRPLEDRS